MTTSRGVVSSARAGVVVGRKMSVVGRAKRTNQFNCRDKS